VLQRFRVGLNFALSGRKQLDGMIARHSVMARSLAGEIGLPAAVQEAVAASYEQWDGKGWPGDLKGEAVPIAARVSQLAEFIEVAHRSAGVEAAVALSRRLAGSQFDPDLAASLSSAAGEILHGLDQARTWDEVIAAEPALARPLCGEELDEALGAVADFVDLKSPYTLGHARGVSCERDHLTPLHTATATRRRAAGWSSLVTPGALSYRPVGAGAG
jgi:HD domain